MYLEFSSIAEVVINRISRDIREAGDTPLLELLVPQKFAFFGGGSFCGSVCFVWAG